MKSDSSTRLYNMARQYFERPELERFIQKIRSYHADPNLEFFQLRQEGEAITLEYGALLDQIVADITMTRQELREVIIRRSAIHRVHVSVLEERVELNLGYVGPGNLAYEATSKPAREALLEYSERIRALFLQGAL